MFYVKHCNSVGLSIKAGPLAAPPLTPHQASPEDSQVPSSLGGAPPNIPLSLLLTGVPFLQELVKNFDESHVAYSTVEVIYRDHPMFLLRW